MQPVERPAVSRLPLAMLAESRREDRRREKPEMERVKISHCGQFSQVLPPLACANVSTEDRRFQLHLSLEFRQR
jgi:hypothetical protein